MYVFVFALIAHLRLSHKSDYGAFYRFGCIICAKYLFELLMLEMIWSAKGWSIGHISLDAFVFE